LKEYGVGVGIRLIWLRIELIAGSSKRGNEHSGYIKDEEFLD
jgi:hypothetical protein